MKESIPVPLVLAFGILAEAGSGSGLTDVLSPLTQLGALGLLAIYLFWAMKERKDERAARQEDNKAEREARLGEIRSIAESHKAQLAELAALAKSQLTETVAALREQRSELLKVLGYKPDGPGKPGG